MSTSQTYPTPRTATGDGELTYTIGARTDKGMQRSANEDTVAVLELPGADAAFVLADGMGGLRAGDVASNETVRVVRETLTEQLATGAEPESALMEAFRRANDAVNGLARPALPEATAGSATGDTDAAAAAAAPPSNALMGSTCVAGIVRGGVLYLAHAGDSRAYLYRDGELARLTDDHSFVADRVRAGDMTEAEARVSRFRNMITRAIGIEATLQPEIRREALLPGDTILACSDGLTTMLEDDEIAAVLGSRHTVRLSPERAASALVDAANKKGGEDNITVVLLRAYEPGQENALAAPTSASSAMPAGARGAAARPGAVIDMDRPAAPGVSSGGPLAAGRSGGGLLAAWPLVLVFALVGAAAAITAGGLAASPELRAHMARLLGGAGTPATRANGNVVTVTPGPVDFSRLTYDKPADFGTFAARGDLLAYSPGAGLYFVAESSGKVVCLSRSGEPVHNVEDLAPAPPIAPPIPDTRVFMTTDPQGNVYFSFTRRKLIEKRGSDGRLLLRLTGLAQPEALAVDEVGNLYVVDLNTVKVLRAHPAGAVSPLPVPASAPTGTGGAPAPRPKKG